jgi:hypothetical protein
MTAIGRPLASPSLGGTRVGKRRVTQRVQPTRCCQRARPPRSAVSGGESAHVAACGTARRIDELAASITARRCRSSCARSGRGDVLTSRPPPQAAAADTGDRRHESAPHPHQLADHDADHFVPPAAAPHSHASPSQRSASTRNPAMRTATAPERSSISASGIIRVQHRGQVPSAPWTTTCGHSCFVQVEQRRGEPTAMRRGAIVLSRETLRITQDRESRGYQPGGHSPRRGW